MTSTLRKLTVETCTRSSTEYQEYPGWTMGREHRLYLPGGEGGPWVELHIQGWATTETMAAHKRGDHTAMPSFFFEAKAFYTDGRPTRNIAGGHIETSEVARRLREYATDATDAAWAYVLDRVETDL